MTLFLDVRHSSVGGNLAGEVSLFQGTSIDDYGSLAIGDLLDAIRGRHVLIGIHGFNVDRRNGIAQFYNWEGLLNLDPPSIFIGLLWPGDSVWAHGLDYPAEIRIAKESGDLIAPFIDSNFGNAASISFVSHSLGTRVLLQTVSKMSLPVREITLMAGAIDDNCLNNEYQAVAAKVGKISVLASKKDDVLSLLFPLGNLFAGIITEGHPWWHAALGHCGPSSPKPKTFLAPFEIPDNWNYGHHHYLQIDPPSSSTIPMPAIVPQNGTAAPVAAGWQQAWSAAFCSTRYSI